MSAPQAEFAGDERVEVLDVTDLVELELDQVVDVVLSNAVFHWIPRPPAPVRPAARAASSRRTLAAQCGGEGKIDRFHRVAAEVARREPYAERELVEPVELPRGA